MSLRDRIMEDLKTAMKAGESDRVAQLRGITTKIKDLDVAARADQSDVGDQDILAALRSMIKSRTESANLYRQGNRPELAEKEEGEIATIKSYLPPEPDKDEVHSVIDEIISAVGATGMREMGKVMENVKERFGVSIDLGKISELIKSRLSK